MLHRHRMASKSFKSFLGSQNLPQQLPENELRDLVIQLCYGDGLSDFPTNTGDTRTHVMGAIIKGHIRLASQIAGRYMWRHPHKTEDIVAAAMLGLVKAVEWAPTRLEDTNITPYIVSTIHRHISDFLETDHLIKIPRDAYKKRLQANKYIPIIFDIDPKEDDEENREYDTVGSFDPPVYDTDKPIEFEDLCSSLELTHEERRIIDLRVKGYTQQEVGEIIGKKRQWIGFVLEKLQERYIKIFGESSSLSSLVTPLLSD